MSTSRLIALHAGRATPSATLYSALLRELNSKVKDARFRKVARGKFTLRS